MRPFLVLLLVIAALGGFWFALNAGDATAPDGTEGVNPNTTVTPGGSSDTTDASTVLVAPAAIDAQAEAGDGRARVAPRPSGDLGTVLKGRVVDQAGEPVPAAEVVLSKRSLFSFEQHDTSSDRTTETDAKGAFRFDAVEVYDAYTVIARHPSFGRYEETDVGIFEGEQIEVELTLGGGLRLYGTVTDTTGSVIPGARLVLGLSALGQIGRDSKDARLTTTDPNGTYEFANLAQGNYALTASADGYGSVSMTQLNVSGDQDMRIDLTLGVAMMIGGRITSMKDGGPVPKALVQAYLNSRKRDTTRTEIRTDEAGDFLIQDVPAGNYTLLIRADGYKVERLSRIDAGDMAVSVALQPNPTVSGQVIDASSGQPLRHFTVQLRQEVPNTNVSAPWPGSKTTIDDKEGRFQLTCPKPGDYIVDAASAGHPSCFSSKFTVSYGDDVEGVNVFMTVGGTIAGRVMSAGRPVAGALVTSRDSDWSDDLFVRSLGDQYPTNASSVTTRTNAEGRFVIRPLTPSTYLVEVKHKEFASLLQRDISVSEGLQTKVGDLVVSRGATISGTVFGPNGAPTPNARVEIVMDNTGARMRFPARYNTKTDKDGRYTLRHVTAGDYLLFAIRPQSRNSANPFQPISDRTATQRNMAVDEGQRYQGINFNLSN